MKTETLNIAILPSDEVTTQAITMSKKIADEVGSRFILNFDNLIPHITIYQAQYPNKNIDKLKKLVQDLSSRNSFEINLDVLTISHETFLFWECEKTDILRELQARAIKIANPLREGLVPAQLFNVMGLSEGDKYDAKTFGALLIGPRYEPHITITTLKRKEDANKAIRILGSSRKLSFKPKALILGYLGEHGTVTEIVESFRFK
jgi:hypothetical protein